MSFPGAYRLFTKREQSSCDPCHGRDIVYSTIFLMRLLT